MSFCQQIVIFRAELFPLQNPMWKGHPSAPEHVTMFGNRASAEVIKMRSQGRALIQLDHCPWMEVRTQTRTEGGPREDRRQCLQAQGRGLRAQPPCPQPHLSLGAKLGCALSPASGTGSGCRGRLMQSYWEHLLSAETFSQDRILYRLSHFPLPVEEPNRI